MILDSTQTNVALIASLIGACLLTARFRDLIMCHLHMENCGFYDPNKPDPRKWAKQKFVAVASAEASSASSPDEQKSEPWAELKSAIIYYSIDAIEIALLTFSIVGLIYRSCKKMRRVRKRSEACTCRCPVDCSNSVGQYAPPKGYDHYDLRGDGYYHAPDGGHKIASVNPLSSSPLPERLSKRVFERQERSAA